MLSWQVGRVKITRIVEIRKGDSNRIEHQQTEERLQHGEKPDIHDAVSLVCLLELHDVQHSLHVRDLVGGGHRLGDHLPFGVGHLL
jgi:hypothetical protein